MHDLSLDRRRGLVEFVAGNMLYVLLHEMGHVHITEMGLPVLGRDDACSRYFTRSELRKRFADRLELTPVQRAKVDSILDVKRSAMDSIQAPVKAAMTAVSDVATRRIEAVLDARQRQEFAEMRADRDRRDREDSAQRVIRKE